MVVNVQAHGSGGSGPSGLLRARATSRPCPLGHVWSAETRTILTAALALLKMDSPELGSR
jgi:hypothetical protein